MKATATAHPIQGLIKYHGLADFRTRQPLHDSISVCTAPTLTTTTVEAGHDADQVSIDGVVVQGRPLERAGNVLDAIRTHMDEPTHFRVVSTSNFPQEVGLGSSSSGFAALAMAAQAAAGLGLDPQAVARIARLGAGSAARAVTGGVSDWRIEGGDSTSYQLAGPAQLDWPILMCVVDHNEPTENVHRDVMESPLLKARVDYIDGALTAMRNAVKQGDREAIFALAERDTLNLHAVTMTGKAGRITWQPATVAVMRACWRLREAGVPAYFSIDTGATPYVNTLDGHQEEVADALTDIDGVTTVMRGRVGGATRIVSEHLF